MVVGNNESTITTKNLGQLLAVLIVMWMRQYDAGRIVRWSTSRATLEATGCLHWASACDVSPRRPTGFHPVWYTVLPDCAIFISKCRILKVGYT